MSTSSNETTLGKKLTMSAISQDKRMAALLHVKAMKQERIAKLMEEMKKAQEESTAIAEEIKKKEEEEKRSVQETSSSCETIEQMQKANNIMFENFLRKRVKEVMDYDLFKRIFLCEDTYLTGSTILEGLTGSQWETDLDIVTSAKMAPRVMATLQSILGYADWKRISMKETAYSRVKHTEFGKTILRRFDNGKIKIDVIIMDKGQNPLEYIKSFDFRFCRNYWDGKNVFCMDAWSVKQKKHQCEREKRTAVRKRGEREYSAEREQKYKRRGFDIAPQWMRKWDSETD